MSTELKIFDMGDDCEWWIGDATPEQMKEAYRAEYGDPLAGEDWEVREITEDELDRLRFFDPDGGERSFREQLSLEDHSNQKPRIFACTEY